MVQMNKKHRNGTKKKNILFNEEETKREKTSKTKPGSVPIDVKARKAFSSKENMSLFISHVQ